MNAAVFPVDHSDSLEDGLALAEVQVLPTDDLSTASRPIDDADLLIVELGVGAVRQLREVQRLEEQLGIPVLIVVAPEQLALLESSGVSADFTVSPVDPLEFRLRVKRMVNEHPSDPVLRFKDLELNPLTYQATIAGVAMDLTYMEYELLRFMVENPVRVWSREQLLSRVWGYEYYGGARTVDVHVRRLRSKLGEERSSWITTVRSVGYRWG